MKKIIALVLALTMIACAACASAATVGICQLVQHDALDAATQGFKDALTEKMPDVEFDEQNASGDAATCAIITSTFASNGVDLLMANATPALQAAVAATGDIPILATSITEYGVALDIDTTIYDIDRSVPMTMDLILSAVHSEDGDQGLIFFVDNILRKVPQDTLTEEMNKSIDDWYGRAKDALLRKEHS